jgi:cytosine/creatinine deaminase
MAVTSTPTEARAEQQSLSAPFSLAGTNRFVLAGARVLASQLPEKTAPVDRNGFALTDILIDQGGIAEVGPAGRGEFGEAPIADLAGRIVLPLFVDAHTHLDKAHIWRRAPNPTGDFAGALKAVADDRTARWTASDVAARMEFCLRTAYAHGTAAIRTHIDSIGPQTLISWPVVAKIRERWRGRIDLQAAPLFLIEFALDPSHMANVEAMLDAYGSNVLGAAIRMVPRLSEGLEILFSLAERKGWDLDFHVDESSDPAARSLGVIAETAIARRFPGRILVGHCCSLSLQEPDEQQRTIEAVAKAGIDVVSLPMCNMFLQDRQAGRTPRWRGVTALHELKDAGVNVMIASDNVRDPFYAYGDLDMMEVWREGVRILHLDYPFADWARVVRAAPAKAMGIEIDGLRAGARADLVLTRARDFTELFSRPHADRTVLRNGAPSPPPPDYAEIDALEGLS